MLISMRIKTNIKFFKNRGLHKLVRFHTGQPPGFTESVDSLRCVHFTTLCDSLPDTRNYVYRGSYMSAHVLLNLLNELGERDKMRGLPSILSLFRNSFNKFNNTRARMLDSIYHMTNTLKYHFWRKNVIILSLCAQRCYGRHNVSRKSINH